MSLYEAICTLTLNLRMIWDTLLMISSVSSKTTFSLCEMFVNQQRSGLADKVINACVLKTFNFKNNFYIVNICGI